MHISDANNFLRIKAIRPHADIVGDGPNLCGESASIPFSLRPVTGRAPCDTANPAATPSRELSLAELIERFRKPVGGFPKSSEPQRDVVKLVDALAAGGTLEEAMQTAIVKDYPKPDYYHGPVMPEHLRGYRAERLTSEDIARLAERAPRDVHVHVATPNAAVFRKPSPSFWLGGDKVTVRQVRNSLLCVKQAAQVIGPFCNPVKCILQDSGKVLIADLDPEHEKITVADLNRVLRDFNQDAEVIGHTCLPIKHIFSQTDDRVLLTEGGDDKSFETCKAKFDNTAHFSGEPLFVERIRSHAPRPISGLPNMPEHTGGCWGRRDNPFDEPTPVSPFGQELAPLPATDMPSRGQITHDQFIKVCEALWSEIKYQNDLPRRTEDEANGAAAFATLLRRYLRKLEDHWADNPGNKQPEGNVAVDECLHDFRKLAAIMVRAMAYCGIRKREVW